MIWICCEIADNWSSFKRLNYDVFGAVSCGEVMTMSGKVLTRSSHLIEAPPCTGLHQSDENPTHRLEVYTLIAVEDQHLGK